MAVTPAAPSHTPPTLTAEAEVFDRAQLAAHLRALSGQHRHLCPRQVLGVRMGLLAGRWLGLPLPQTGKRLLAIVETDGCFADGVATATNCWLGHRTLRLEDYGKVAATFVDTVTGQAVRLAARASARTAAHSCAPAARTRWEAMLTGYQHLPEAELFTVQPVALRQPVAALVSRAGARTICAHCGEEILNERETLTPAGPLCRACAGPAYYTPLG
jgi:formylmethanofuran dehydrogenase subunit E